MECWQIGWAEIQAIKNRLSPLSALHRSHWRCKCNQKKRTVGVAPLPWAPPTWPKAQLNFSVKHQQSVDGCGWIFGLRLDRSVQGDTFANRLRVIPVRIPRADALDDRGALLQRVAGVAGELNHSSNTVERVGGGEVAVLEVRLVAVAALKSWRSKRSKRQG